MAKKSLLEFAAVARRRCARCAVLVVCSAALFSGGIVIAAEAGSPETALAVARSFLGREFTVNASPYPYPGRQGNHSRKARPASLQHEAG